MKRFLTVAETAALLGVSEATLYRAIRAKKFPAVKIRERYVIPMKVIDEIEAAAMWRAGRTWTPRSST